MTGSRQLHAGWRVLVGAAALLACDPKVQVGLDHIALDAPGGHSGATAEAGGSSVGGAGATAAAGSSSGGSPGILFSADHETGDFSEWSAAAGPFLRGDATLAVTDAQAHSGNYGAVGSILSSGIDDTTAATFQPIQALEATYGAWFLIPELVETSHWELFGFNDATPEVTTPDRFDVAVASDAGSFGLRLFEHGVGYTETDAVVPIGRWFHLEVFLRAAPEDGRLVLWLDGTQVLEIGPQPTAASDRISWGIGNIGGPAPSTLYFDDAEVRAGAP